MFATVYKKSVETCLAHHKPRHRQTPLQKWTEKQIPHAVAYMDKSVQPTEDCTRPCICKDRMSVALSSSLCFEIGDFGLWDKARNAFLTQGFLPSGFAKLEQTERNIKYIWIFLRCRLIKRCAQHRLKIVCLISDCKTSYSLREHCICNRIAPLAARRQEQRVRSSGYLFLIIRIAMTLQYVQRSGDESIATPITATAT